MNPKDEFSSGEVGDLLCLHGILITFIDASLEREYVFLSSNFDVLLLTLALRSKLTVLYRFASKSSCDWS